MAASSPVNGWLASGKIAAGSSGAIALTNGTNDGEAISLGAYSTLSLGRPWAARPPTRSLTPSASTYYLGGGGGTAAFSFSLTGAGYNLVAGNGAADLVVLTGLQHL